MNIVPTMIKIEKNGDAKLCTSSDTLTTIQGKAYGGFIGGQIVGNEVHLNAGNGDLRIYTLQGSIIRVR